MRFEAWALRTGLVATAASVFLAGCKGERPIISTPTPRPIPTEIATPRTIVETSQILPGPEANLVDAPNISVLNESPYPVYIVENAFQQLAIDRGVAQIPIKLVISNERFFVYIDPITGFATLLTDPSIIDDPNIEQARALTQISRGEGINDHDVTKPIQSAEIKLSLPSMELKVAREKRRPIVWESVAHEFYHLGRLNQGDAFVSSLNSEERAEGYGFAVMLRGSGRSYDDYLEYMKTRPSFIPVDKDVFTKLNVIGNDAIGIYLPDWNK